MLVRIADRWTPDQLYTMFWKLDLKSQADLDKVIPRLGWDTFALLSSIL